MYSMPHIHFAIAPQFTQPVEGIIFNISYHIPHSFDYNLQFTTLIAITSHNNEGSQMSRQPSHTKNETAEEEQEERTNVKLNNRSAYSSYSMQSNAAPQKHNNEL